MNTGSPAYAVPFRLRRRAVGSFVLTNASRETVHGVSFTLHGAGVMSLTAPAKLEPGAEVEVTVRGVDLARATILVIRWFRANGDEYLWRVAF